MREKVPFPPPGHFIGRQVCIQSTWFHAPCGLRGMLGPRAVGP